MSEQHGMSVPSNKSIIQSPAVVRRASPKQEDEVEVVEVGFGDKEEKDEGKNYDSSNQPDIATSLSAASKAATQGNQDELRDRYVTENGIKGGDCPSRVKER